MRVLCVTFEAPSQMYGGGLGIIQSLTSLSANAEIDYIGPAFLPESFEQIRLRRRYVLEEETGFFRKAFNLLRGVPVRYYDTWRRVSSRIDPGDYDMVFVDFSYNDFVVKWAFGRARTLVRVHNIERDMAANIVRSKVLDKYWLRSFLNGWIVARREKKCLKMADGIIFLTREDMDRGCCLFGRELREKSTIIPVCMEMADADRPSRQPSDYILATGSLYYGPNALGIKWFIRNVWAGIQRDQLLPDMRLLVAGRHPDPEMIELCEKTPNCVLADTPEDIAPYFQQARLYVAPIFSGAGMKVKVAEALSYGLRVIGTHHALIGYEEAGEFTCEADDAAAFRELILKHARQYSETERRECREMCKRVYSMERSKKSFGKVVKCLSEGRKFYGKSM